MESAMKRLTVQTLFLLLALVISACAAPSADGSLSEEFVPTPLEAFPKELGAGFPVAARVEEGGADVGDTAPNFAFFLEDGRRARPVHCRARRWYLQFWGDLVQPVPGQMPELVALHEGDPDIVVLEVNVGEDLAAVEEFAAEFGMNMAVVLDQEDTLRRAYGVRNMPTTVFIRTDGTIGARWPGILVGEQLSDFVEQIRTQ